MRGFRTPPTKPLTFSRGEESLTLAVSALPPLFRTRLRMSWPEPSEEDGDTASLNYILRRGVILAAEGIRRTEEGIPDLPTGGDLVEWLSYSDALLQMFADAGLNDADVQAIAQATVDLSETSSLSEVEAEGNG